MPLKDLARLREGSYRLFGTLLLYPDGDWIATLSRLAERLAEETQPFRQFAFWAQWERLLGALQRLSDGDRSALEAEYVNGLVVPSGEEAGLLYESSYVPRKDVAWVMAELAGEYARLGFSLDPAVNEPPDHAAIELEFMSLLCGKEGEAWIRENLAESVGCLYRERRFLVQHLFQWFPEFTRQAANRNDPGFYALVADAAHAFIAHDLDLVTALLGRLQEVAQT
ncbi:MAG: molecular chaperone [Nitrospinota bacterium]